mmetsp:Transcript_25968/g.68107  ORF Transcript_25968/g.68107 Transcript_25968/m.68107 type:complete len:216 (-) Transcript_25968:159-806(-)
MQLEKHRIQDASSQVTPRRDPVDLVLWRLKVEELHVDAVLTMCDNETPSKKKTGSHANKEISEIMLRDVVTIDTLPKREPRTFPRHLGLVCDFCFGSVRHWDEPTMDLQGFCERVEHLLVVIKRHLASNELISVRLKFHCVVSEFLEPRIILRRHEVRVADGRRHLWRNVRRNAELVSGHHVILNLHLWVPSRLVKTNGIHYRPTRIASQTVPES